MRNVVMVSPLGMLGHPFGSGMFGIVAGEELSPKELPEGATHHQTLSRSYDYGDVSVTAYGKDADEVRNNMRNLLKELLDALGK